jgi:hypothetical protein
MASAGAQRSARPGTGPSCMIPARSYPTFKEALVSVQNGILCLSSLFCSFLRRPDSRPGVLAGHREDASGIRSLCRAADTMHDAISLLFL